MTEDEAYGGSHGCRLSVVGGTDGWGTWGGAIRFPSKLVRGDQLWIRVRTKVPMDFDYGSYGAGERLKFLRVHTAGEDGKHIGYDDLYIQREGSANPFNWIYESEEIWSPVGETSDGIQRGTWETYEIYLKFDNVPQAAGGAARVRIWKNGRLLKDIQDRITLRTALAYADYFYFFTYWNGNAPKTQFMFTDDVIVQSAVPSARDAEGFAFIGTENEIPDSQRPASPENLRVTSLGCVLASSHGDAFSSSPPATLSMASACTGLAKEATVAAR